MDEGQGGMELEGWMKEGDRWNGQAHDYRQENLLNEFKVGRKGRKRGWEEGMEGGRNEERKEGRKEEGREGRKEGRREGGKKGEKEEKTDGQKERLQER